MAQTFGKKNIIFGVVYLFLAMGLNAFAGQGETYQEALSQAFLNANLDAGLNIIIGFIIMRLPFVDWLSRAISVLMISGALLHSGTLYLSGFGVAYAAVIMPLGAAILAVVMLFTGIGALSVKVTR